MSIKVAQNFNGEVISGDSMQVYRKLDIGTAKITDSEKQGVPHHLINIRDITERYSVADFIHDATEQIAQITSRGHLPIIVGGTGFYLQALLDGLELGGDQYTDDGLRKKLYQIADTEGNMALHNRLASVDPKAAAQISANNVRRVIRHLKFTEKRIIYFLIRRIIHSRLIRSLLGLIPIASCYIKESTNVLTS